MLKTICKGCIFNTSFPLLDRTGCRLDKPVYILEKDQFTDGYCRHKRTESWSLEKPSIGILTAISNVIEEEAFVSAVVLSFDSDPNNFQKTIDSIVSHRDLITQIIVMTYDKDELLKQKMEMVNECGIPWSVDNLLETPPDDLSVVNYSFRLVKNNWFCVLKDGNILSDKSCERIKEILLDVTDNTVAIYVDEEDNLRLFVNKHAFAQMSGNNELPWFDKVKAFENWKEVCKTIK